MISLTIEANDPEEFRAKVLAVFASMSNDASLVAAPAAEPVAEPVVETKKPRGRPAKKKSETIEASAEEVKTEPEKEPEPAPEPDTEPDTEAPNRQKVKDLVYAYMDVRMAAATDDKGEAGRKAFGELLTEFKVERFSLLPEDKFVEAIEWAKAKTAEAESEATEDKG